MKITHLTILFLLLSIFTSYGQEDCATKLSKAQKQYDAGQIEEIQQMLQPCIKDGFTKEEIQTAQKLIIQTNVFDKNNKAADSAMLQFLKKYPEYEIVPSDQAEFVQLFETYQTKPVASVGGLIGLNYTFIKYYDVQDANLVKLNYKPLMGLLLGLTFKKPIIGRYDFCFDLIYQQNKFEYTGNYLSDDEPSEPYSTTLTETQSCIAIPLSIIYTPLKFSKASLYTRLGTTLSYMISSTGDISRDPKIESPVANYSLINYRNPIQVSGLFGIGATLKLPHSYLQLDARYNLGISPQVKEDNRGPAANDSEIKDSFSFPKNGFSVSNLAFNLGFYYKFYSPRKK